MDWYNTLRIEPKNHFINWQQDPFGNILARVVFPEKCRKLSVEVEVIADMTVINPFDFFVEDYAEKYPFNYDPLTLKELQPYLEIAEKGPLLRQWVNDFDLSKRNITDFLVDINRKVFEVIGYNIRMEVGIQSCEDTLEKRSGSCRDSAWLLVQILRHLGLAARFVSSYLVQLTADIKALDGPSGPAQDFTDLHAWAEVYIPGAGWIGLDPTSGLLAGEGHIPLACTPELTSAAPVTGGTDEWNTHADGANKRERAQQLTLRLRDVFSKGAMLHYGQGKWYPGEPLPRWQYGVFWRKDDEGSRYFCESLFWASQPKQAAKT